MIKLRDILLEKGSILDKTFGEVPFDNEKEPNTEVEAKIFQLLQDWLNDADTQTAEEMYHYQSILKQAKTKFPDIFKPATANGTLLYRGLSMVNNMRASLGIIIEIINTNKLIDPDTGDINEKNYNDAFDKVVFNGDEFLRYKKPVPYNPHKLIQSWTNDFEVTQWFSTTFCLETKQDDDFIFNQNYLNKLFGGNAESETIHFGKTYKNPIYFIFAKKAIDQEIWYRSKRAKGEPI